MFWCMEGGGGGVRVEGAAMAGLSAGPIILGMIALSKLLTYHL